MRCKPGDIAVIIKSTCGNEGKFVDVLSYYEQGQYTFPDGATNASAGWCVYRKEGLNTWNLFFGASDPVQYGVMPDPWLLPVNGDQPSVDLVKEKELEDA